jgi:hypothetical protein
MPAPKRLPKFDQIIKQHDALFIGNDKLINNRDSRALGMLAKALDAVTTITTAPPWSRPKNWRLIFRAACPCIYSTDEKLAKQFPIKSWERKLGEVFKQTDFSGIRAVFPEDVATSVPNSVTKKKNDNLNNELTAPECRATHQLHPRLRVLEQACLQDRLDFPSFDNRLGYPRDRIHELEITINRDANDNRADYDKHIRHVNTSQTNAIKFANELLFTRGKSQKLQVIQLILGYSPLQSIQQDIFVPYSQMKGHWEKFCRQLRKLNCAYIAKLAHSRYRSYYFHLLLFFPREASPEAIREQLKKVPQQKQISLSKKPLSNDELIADVLGELWVELSSTERLPPQGVHQTLGRFYNLNAQRPLRPGLGLVGYSDTKQRKAIANQILKPIFGIDMYVRFIPPKEKNAKHGDRTFWKGGKDRLPVPPPAKRGRPFKISPNQKVTK